MYTAIFLKESRMFEKEMIEILNCRKTESSDGLENLFGAEIVLFLTKAFLITKKV
ncbi:MAG: hypothetical protein IJS54_00135 [Desulfovibrio sp.]|nr:hypothetical protein [Desulfovibrio sp.]